MNWNDSFLSEISEDDILDVEVLDLEKVRQVLKSDQPLSREKIIEKL